MKYFKNTIQNHLVQTCFDILKKLLDSPSVPRHINQRHGVVHDNVLRQRWAGHQQRHVHGGLPRACLGKVAQIAWGSLRDGAVHDLEGLLS